MTVLPTTYNILSNILLTKLPPYVDESTGRTVLYNSLSEFGTPM
jgi:hypothetical protein